MKTKFSSDPNKRSHSSIFIPYFQYVFNHLQPMLIHSHPRSTGHHRSPQVTTGPGWFHASRYLCGGRKGGRAHWGRRQEGADAVWRSWWDVFEWRFIGGRWTSPVILDGVFLGWNMLRLISFWLEQIVEIPWWEWCSHVGEVWSWLFHVIYGDFRFHVFPFRWASKFHLSGHACLCSICFSSQFCESSQAWKRVVTLRWSLNEHDVTHRTFDCGTQEIQWIRLK